MTFAFQMFLAVMLVSMWFEDDEKKEEELSKTFYNSSVAGTMLPGPQCVYSTRGLQHPRHGVGHSLDLPEGWSGDSRLRPEVHSRPRP